MDQQNGVSCFYRQQSEVLFPELSSQLPVTLALENPRPLLEGTQIRVVYAHTYTHTKGKENFSPSNPCVGYPACS